MRDRSANLQASCKTTAVRHRLPKAIVTWLRTVSQVALAGRILQWRRGWIALAWLCVVAFPRTAWAQPGIPSLETVVSGGDGRTGASPPVASSAGAPSGLPNQSGQVWRSYDIRPYTKELKNIDRPHQAIVDWVLRETGTDVWFSEPFGILNADRETLRVYHNQQMQDIVASIHERFVNGTTAPQRYGLRIVTIGNPNWRTRAMALMRSVQAKSPGVQAFLLSKENYAVLMSMLRGRVDYHELSSVDIVLHNGQPQVLEQTRGRNYVSDFKPVAGAWPPYMPSTGEIKEGYQLQISPLLSLDESEVDLVVKCNIDQVERLVNVNLDLPLSNGQVYTGQVNVPQVVSWRLHERFRWPSDQVLLLSCGVVAAPDGTNNSSLLGVGGNVLGLGRILPNSNRADALLMIEYRGDASDGVPSNPAAGQTNLASPLNPLSRGRY